MKCPFTIHHAPYPPWIEKIGAFDVGWDSAIQHHFLQPKKRDNALSWYICQNQCHHKNYYGSQMHFFNPCQFNQTIDDGLFENVCIYIQNSTFCSIVFTFLSIYRYYILRISTIIQTLLIFDFPKISHVLISFLPSNCYRLCCLYICLMLEWIISNMALNQNVIFFFSIVNHNIRSNPIRENECVYVNI